MNYATPVSSTKIRLIAYEILYVPWLKFMFPQIMNPVCYMNP